jgi:hypothetical protein
VLGDIPLRRFESVLELGADDVAPASARALLSRVACAFCMSVARSAPRACATRSGRWRIWAICRA